VFELEVKRPMAVIYLDCSESTMEKRVKALGNIPFPGCYIIFKHLVE
jgi:hypothetical protein